MLGYRIIGIRADGVNEPELSNKSYGFIGSYVPRIWLVIRRTSGVVGDNTCLTRSGGHKLLLVFFSPLITSQFP